MSILGSINGVICEPLTVISDDRGAVLRMFRNDSQLFSVFGEIYFSEVNPRVVKGWKRHLRMTQHFAVPHGRIKVVIYDAREDSSTYGQIVEVMLGRPFDYELLIIPPLLWYGFQGISNFPSLICNCTDLTHDPFESEKHELVNDIIPYSWE